MTIKERLSNSIIEGRFSDVIEELKKKSQENFKNTLSVGSKRIAGTNKTLVLYKEEKEKKLFYSFLIWRQKDRSLHI